MAKPKTKRFVRQALSATALALVGAIACWPERPGIEGACQLVPQSTLDCRVQSYEDQITEAGLVGYACSGSMRPDLDATFSDGVPQGLMCADKGLLPSGEAAYCCTEDIVPCAYDPTGDCLEGESGYECYSNNRPESLNAGLLCTNGTEERGLTHYCCTGQPEPPKCREEKAVGCSTRLLGFICEGDARPRGENLGANRSRADHFYPICSNAEAAPNPDYNTFCCFMHMRQPEGGTCVPDPVVPGCEPGRFGFACYGPDHPEDNFPPITCPHPGFAGRSAEGYEATLYCCDFT